jgi:nucleotide-binding universal stress UspA family protein
MKNFIAVFDGYKMSESTLAYAIHLSKASDAVLTGVFLDAFFYHNYNLKSVLKQQSDSGEVIEALREKDRKQRDLAVMEFQKVCNAAGVRYAVHRDESLPVQELRYESMFADLIIINEHETFSRSAESSPYEFIDALLVQSHCPVLVVPDVFSPLQQLVFLYDGSPSSIFSMKLFGYLFSGLSDLPVTVLTVNEADTEELYLPEDLQIRGLAGRLFSNVSYEVLKGKAKEQISGAIGTEAGKLVLMGAYKLNMVTGLFTESIADRLLEIRDMPVFIPPKNCA